MSNHLSPRRPLAASPRPSSPCLRVPASPRPRVLIIGYGNPLRGDDGIGWRLAQELSETLASDEVAVLAQHQLTPELAEPISRAECVIFMDATIEGTPGRLVYAPLKPAELAPGSFTHNVNPATLLALAQALYEHCPEARVLAVTGASFGYTEQLSPVVAAVVPEALARVKQEIMTRREGDAVQE